MDTNDTITQDGEIIESGALQIISPGFASEMSKAEISQQVATAHQYPRSISRAVKNIVSLATMDEEAAAEAIYALPRGGKPIRGPSIRLAEIVAQQWGNNRLAVRVIEVDRVEKVIVAEAVFHDLETNAAQKSTVRRRISDRQGRLLNDDMIVVTGNAACSIARRNAILASVPKAVWRKAYDAAEGVVKGDVKTLAERRHKAISSFGTWGVKPEQIYAALGVSGQDDITLEHIPTLVGMFNAIKNGEETVESLFSNRATAGGKAFDKVADPLNDSDGKGPAAAAGAAQTTKSNPDASAGFGETRPEASGQGASTSSRLAEAGGAAPTRESGTTGDEKNPIDEARAAGRTTAMRGGAKKLPAALKGDDRAEEAAAWTDGYDQAVAEAEAGDSSDQGEG